MFDVCAYRDDDFIQQFLCVYLSPRSFPMFSIAYCVCVCVYIYIYIYIYTSARFICAKVSTLCKYFYTSRARASSN